MLASLRQPLTGRRITGRRERFFPAVNVHADTLELLEKYLEDKNE